MIGTLWQDLRYGARMLMKSPGFTAVAIITLALGIGANTTLFSVVNAVLLRPLPYEGSEQLVRLWQTTAGFSDRTRASALNFSDWREQSQSFEAMAAYNDNTAYNLSGAGEPERVAGAPVSASLFSILRVRPVIGREFLAEEDQPGGNKVVILSHGFWQQHFGGESAVLGKTILLNGAPRTIVGVMPRGFGFPKPETALWVPAAMDSKDMGRGNYFLNVIARLKPGVTSAQAQADLDKIAARLEKLYPVTNTDSRVILVPEHEEVTGKIRPMLLVLLGAVGFVLMIACANVANLLLARAAARQKEIAIRAALGASRFRIVRQLLIESLLLSTFGGALGLLAATFGLKALIAASPADLPRIAEISLDNHVLVFTIVVSMLTGILFGLAPALQVSKPNLNETLKESGRHSTTGTGLLRSGFVVVQVALSLILLIGAGLIIRSFWRLLGTSPGFTHEKVLTAKLSLPFAKYPQPSQSANFFQQVIQRVETLPGVQSVGATSALPLSGMNNSRYFYINGRPHAGARDYTLAAYRVVSKGYFRTMGIPLLKGRDLSERDAGETEPVVIINEALARRFFPDEDPLGKQMKMGEGPDSPNPWMTIVGVIGDVKHRAMDEEARPELYRPFIQTPEWEMAVTIRTAQKSESLIAAIRREVMAIDSDQPLANVSTMEQLMDKSVARRRFNMSLLAMFGTLAMLLAAIGLYGVMSYTVAQNTREIGIRMALGAQSTDVLRLIVGQGMALTLIGVAIGIAGAFGLTRLMKNLLYDVTATDPMTFAAVSTLLTIIALFACWLPARKATKTDPIVALRHE